MNFDSYLTKYDEFLTLFYMATRIQYGDQNPIWRQKYNILESTPLPMLNIRLLSHRTFIWLYYYRKDDKKYQKNACQTKKFQMDRPGWISIGFS
jgi:hypothetical protein